VKLLFTAFPLALLPALPAADSPAKPAVTRGVCADQPELKTFVCAGIASSATKHPEKVLSPNLDCYFHHLNGAPMNGK